MGADSMAERRLTFVVAEDEERMRDYLARKTAELDRNFECVGTAADGEEAVELVERYLPDLLITDIKMPVLGGLELVERIRRTNPDLRILIVSGYSEFEYARRAIELGVDDYILKPIDVEKLRETLRRIRIRLEASAGIGGRRVRTGPDRRPGGGPGEGGGALPPGELSASRTPSSGWPRRSDARRRTSCGCTARSRDAPRPRTSSVCGSRRPSACSWDTRSSRSSRWPRRWATTTRCISPGCSRRKRASNPTAFRDSMRRC